MILLLYFILFVFYVGLFTRMILRAPFFEVSGIKRLHLVVFFFLKVTAGILLTLVYTYYYTDPTKADIYRYFTDSKIISSLLFTHPLAWLKVIGSIGRLDTGTIKYLQDTLYVSHPAHDFVTNNTLLIKVISLLNYLSFYNIYVDTLLLGFISFVALVFLLKVLLPYFEDFAQILYWPLFLMPSVVFWSSGLLKESLLFIGVSMYLSQWLSGNTGQKRQQPAVALIGFVIIGLTKVYVAIVLFACSVLLPFRNVKSPGLLVLTRAVVGCAICLFAWFYISHYPVCSLMAEKRNEFIALSIAEHSNSVLDTTLVQADCNHVVALVPEAMVNAVLRPFIRDKGNLLQMFFAVENAVFMLAIAGILLFYFKMPRSHRAWLAAFCFSFSILNYLGIGITVPILGAIVHYRVVAMPFLLLSVLLMADLKKLKLSLSSLSSYLNL